MALIKISELTEETTPADGDLIPIVDVSTNATKKVSRTNLFKNPPLADDSLLPDMLSAGTGSTWAWQSWTPTWTNLTVGNGTASGAYMQIGKTVFARYSLVLGSTSSVSGAVSFAPPVTAVAYGARVSIGTGIIDDVGSATYGCFVCFISTTSFAMYVNNSSTSDLLVQMSGTKPIAAYGTGDIVTFSMTYEAA